MQIQKRRGTDPRLAIPLLVVVLAAFITGLLFRNVDARAVIATLVFGAVCYALLSFGWPAWHKAGAIALKPPHFLHLMFVTVWACVGFALALNRLVFGRRAEFEWSAFSRSNLRAVFSNY